MADLTLLVLRCRNLELSRLVYETLGLTFAPEKHGSGPEHYSTRLGQTVLELYPANEPATPVRIGLRIDDLRRFGHFCPSSEHGLVSAIRASP